MCGIRHSDEVSYRRKSTGKFFAYCKSCAKIRARCHHQNADVEVVKELIQSQDSQCAICGITAVLVLDHDHWTGKTRDLLCHPCNIKLGFIERKKRRLKDTDLPYIAYLEKHKS
jgi:hypothetical protein